MSRPDSAADHAGVLVGKGLGAVVCVALAANVTFAAAHLAAQTHLFAVLSRMPHGEPVLRAEMWVENLSGIQVAAFVGAGLLFVGWFVQAWDQTEALRKPSEPGRRWWQSRTWALAGWFVPFVNLGVPLLIALDMWESGRSRTTARRRSRLWVIAWWLAFVAWTFAGRSAQSLYRRAEQTAAVRDALRTGMLTDSLGVLAALAAITFVWQLTARMAAESGTACAGVGEQRA
ncbi:DUF4328 domain-containing protein [Streptomyces xiangluensis]|uniref:DUF4328 domain-containing protein n=1 Tax=Streptomyces xiangluensis TaxID=2665720 RepID=A0ABV8YL95_9ACTN